jgi:hypothetical protein
MTIFPKVALLATRISDPSRSRNTTKPENECDRDRIAARSLLEMIKSTIDNATPTWRSVMVQMYFVRPSLLTVPWHAFHLRVIATLAIEDCAAAVRDMGQQRPNRRDF